MYVMSNWKLSEHSNDVQNGQQLPCHVLSMSPLLKSIYILTYSNQTKLSSQPPPGTCKQPAIYSQFQQIPSQWHLQSMIHAQSVQYPKSMGGRRQKQSLYVDVVFLLACVCAYSCHWRSYSSITNLTSISQVAYEHKIPAKVSHSKANKFAIIRRIWKFGIYCILWYERIICDMNKIQRNSVPEFDRA